MLELYVRRYEVYHIACTALPHPIIKKNHHFLDSDENTTTNIRYSMMPSHNIQQNADRNK